MRSSGPAALLLVLAALGGCGGGSSSSSSAPAPSTDADLVTAKVAAPTPTPDGAPTPAGQTDRLAIDTLVDEIEAEKDPTTTCSELMTPGFVAQTFGNTPTCEHADQNEATTDKPAGGTVTALLVSGDFATATVTDRGGNTSGAHGTWKFVRSGKDWQLNEVGADYLRQQSALALGKNYKAADAGNPFANAKLRACVLSETQALPDPDYREFANGMTSGQSTIGRYFADCESRTGVGSPFRPGQLAAIRSGNEAKHLPTALTDCIVSRFDKEIDETDLVNAMFDGEGSPSLAKLRTTVADFSNACAVELGLSPTTPSPAP